MISRDLKTYIPLTLKLRGHAWKILSARRDFDAEDETNILHQLKRVCILASSSRGGSSVTSEMLQWQGADCDLPICRMLTLPGEEKPHMILASLCYPGRVQQYDDLDVTDANPQFTDILQKEIRSEIGFPMAFSTDLRTYAIQLYRRLLLQWPLHLCNMDPDTVIAALADELTTEFSEGYRDSQKIAVELLLRAQGAYPL